VDLGGSSQIYRIATITGETTLTVDVNYDGTTSTTQSYEILPQEEYFLPIQCSHRMFLWHEENGRPQQMHFITDQDFLSQGIQANSTGVPSHYRMWGEDMVREQLLEASVIRVDSTSASDTTQTIRVHGHDANGLPTYEDISLNGTTAASGSVSFASVERVSRSASTAGAITIDANSGNTLVAYLPIGDYTAGIQYKKVRLYPLPNTVFPMHVWYYKDPFRLVDDDDIHELGQEFDEALILRATAMIMAKQDQQQAEAAFALYRDEVRNLKKTNVDKIDWFPALQRAGRSTGSDPLLHNHLRYSQVGAHFGPRV
jgi:hypothetical protein